MIQVWHTYTIKIYKTQPWYEYLRSILKAVDTGILSFTFPALVILPAQWTPVTKPSTRTPPDGGKFYWIFWGVKFPMFNFKVVIWWYSTCPIQQPFEPKFQAEQKIHQGLHPRKLTAFAPENTLLQSTGTLGTQNLKLPVGGFDGCRILHQRHRFHGGYFLRNH